MWGIRGDGSGVGWRVTGLWGGMWGHGGVGRDVGLLWGFGDTRWWCSGAWRGVMGHRVGLWGSMWGKESYGVGCGRWGYGGTYGASDGSSVPCPQLCHQG